MRTDSQIRGPFAALHERRRRAHDRRARRNERREWRAANRERWRRRKAFAWRHRYKLVPPLVGLVTSFIAWMSMVAYVAEVKVGGIGLDTIIALTYIGFAGWFTAKKVKRQKDKVAVWFVTAALVIWLYCVTLFWCFGIEGWARAGALVAGSFTLWIPCGVPWWQHYQVRQREGDRKRMEDWPRIAGLIGWEGADLRGKRPFEPVYRDDVADPIGEIIRVQLRPGQSLGEFKQDAAKTAFDLPVGGKVSVEYEGRMEDDDPKSYRDVLIRVIRRNPWRKRLTIVDHPLLEVLPELEEHLRKIAAGEVDTDKHLSDAAKAWLPGTPTVHNHCLIAQSAAGELFYIPLWERNQGAIHWLIGGASGSGKGVLLNNLILALAACRDTWTCYIDTSQKKGKDAKRWGDAIDKLCRSQQEAIDVLEGVLEAIINRATWSADHGTDHLHVPTPEAPLGVVIIDEAASAFNNENDPYRSERIRYLVQEITRLGRSEGWCVIICTQRPDAVDLGGTTKMLTNIKGRIQLPVETKTDGQFVLEHNYTLVNVPVADQTPQGTFVCVDYRGIHEAHQRTFTIRDYPLIERLGRLYSVRPGLDHLSLTGKAAVLGRATVTPDLLKKAGYTTNALPSAANPERNSAVDELFGNIGTTPPVEPPASGRAATRAAIDANHAALAELRKEFAEEGGPDEPKPLDGVEVSELTAGHGQPALGDKPGDALTRRLLLQTMLAKAEDTGKGAQRSDMEDALRQHFHDTGVELPSSAATIQRCLTWLRVQKFAENRGKGVGSYWTATDKGKQAVSAELAST